MKKRRKSSVVPDALEDNSWKGKSLRALDSKHFTIVMSIFTVYALIGDDCRLAAFHKSADDVFFFLSTVALILFIGELTLNCICKDGYIGGFYFWLDAAATLSLVPDIGWIWDSFIESFGEDEGSSAALKAGRASRAGTKAGRIVRIVRLVRMVRIVKLYKMHHGDEDDQLEAAIAAEPSKVGKKMSEMTTRRVIVIVLLLVLMIPVFDGGIDDTVNEFQVYGLKRLHILATQNPQASETALFRNSFDNFVRNAGRVIYLDIANVNKSITDDWIRDVRFQKDGDPSSPYSLTKNPLNDWSADLLEPSTEGVDKNYRTNEFSYQTEEKCYDENSIAVSDECASLAFFDVKPTTRSSAAMNLVKTFFIMLVLGVSSVAFAKIAQSLVITPIERMMNLITQLAENPLASTNNIGMEYEADKVAEEQGYETALLEATLKKIGALMQVGFGAAGADIIGKNMGSGELDPMLPGKKITAIYGFCDIRQFTDTTECLQEEVMVYVNKLGDIMHGGTHAYYGMANKNVGDAFLLSWKITDGELPGYATFDDSPTEEQRIQVNRTHKCPRNSGAGSKMRSISPTEMADSALTAFLKCLIDLDNANTKGCLTPYLSYERVVKRFGKNFRIRMGFGMHVGWAIEGAIGSRFKIDATYISPHVEMADRLEAGSKIFMTPMNLSHWFVALLSPAARKFLRPMDRIKISGVSQPVTVYTFDAVNMKKGFGVPKIGPDGTQASVNFETDSQYSEIQEGLHPGFVPAYRQVYDAYVKGDWTKAHEELKLAMELRPEDGPSKLMLSVLQAHDFVAPSDWPGYRVVEKY